MPTVHLSDLITPGKLNNGFKISFETRSFSTKCLPIICQPKEANEVWRWLKTTCNKNFSIHKNKMKLCFL